MIALDTNILARYLLNDSPAQADIAEKIENNRNKISNQYDWEVINTAYLDFTKKCIKEKK